MPAKTKILFLARATLYQQPGGDTVHLEQYAAYLRKAGFDIHIHTAEKLYRGDYQLIHFFNLGRPEQLLPYLSQKKAIVVSSIYVKYDAVNRQHARAPIRWASNLSDYLPEYLKTLGRYLKAGKLPPLRYLWLGQRRSIERILRKADALITASAAELDLIKKEFAHLPRHCEVLRLGSEHITPLSSPARRGIICVARIEPLKNQLNLIQAHRIHSIPLSLMGTASAPHRGYLEQCRAAAKGTVQFIPHGDNSLVSRELSRHQVHALPSFFETTGLSTLEALAAGCQVVVSDNAIQRELFAGVAHFCDPHSTSSIHEALQSALQDSRDHRAWVAENFSWPGATQKVADIYHKLLSKG